MHKNSVVIHSDRGTGSTYFAKAAGIVETLSPGTNAVDASQSFENGNVGQVMAYLYTSVPYWPNGTVFVSCVGEGRPVVVKLGNGSIIISPDNGTSTMCVGTLGFSGARYVDTNKYGADEWALFRCAVDSASGASFEELGPDAADEVVFLTIPKAVIGDGYAEGAVGMLLRNFGNITFTIGTDEFESTGIHHGDMVEVTFTKDGKTEYHAVMPYQPSFGYVPVGQPVVFNGSSGYMDIGLNMRSFRNECIPQILEEKDPGVFQVRIEKKEGHSETLYSTSV